MISKFFTPATGRGLHSLLAMFYLLALLFLTKLFMAIGAVVAADGFWFFSALIFVLVLPFFVICWFHLVHILRIAATRSPTLILEADRLHYLQPGFFRWFSLRWTQVASIELQPVLLRYRLVVRYKPDAKTFQNEAIAHKVVRLIFEAVVRVLKRLLPGKRHHNGFRQLVITASSVNSLLIKIKEQAEKNADRFHDQGDLREQPVDSEFSVTNILNDYTKTSRFDRVLTSFQQNGALILPFVAVFIGFSMITEVRVSDPVAFEQTEQLRELAKDGDADAQNVLGWRIYNGVGALKSEKQAFKWFMRAANQGFAKAQYNVGRAYFHGEGVKRDYKEAAYWYQKAADQDFTLAQYGLGRLYYKGKGVRRNSNNAKALFEKAAAKGNEKAAYFLGEMNEKGIAFPQSQEKAIEWYKRSAEQGFTPSAKAINRLSSERLGQPRL